MIICSRCGCGNPDGSIVCVDCFQQLNEDSPAALPAPVNPTSWASTLLIITALFVVIFVASAVFIHVSGRPGHVAPSQARDQSEDSTQVQVPTRTTTQVYDQTRGATQATRPTHSGQANSLLPPTAPDARVSVQPQYSPPRSSSFAPSPAPQTNYTAAPPRPSSTTPQSASVNAQSSARERESQQE